MFCGVVLCLITCVLIWLLVLIRDVCLFDVGFGGFTVWCFGCDGADWVWCLGFVVFFTAWLIFLGWV